MRDSDIIIVSRVNLEMNIFDWPVNLNSFSTNEILGWPIKDIFLGFFMILEIDNLLPNELRTIIKKLQKLLDMQENSNIRRNLYV